MKEKRNIGTGERLLSGLLAVGALKLIQRNRNPGLGLLALELARRAMSGHSFVYRALDVNGRSPRSFAVGSHGGIYHSRRSITVNRPREEVYRAWRSSGESRVRTGGTIRFTDAPAGRGTEIHAAIRFRPPGGAIGRKFAQALGLDPDQRLRADLRRFKKLIETGEILTTEGQPSGRVAA